MPNSPVSVVCISDTHNCQPVIPPGEILIHAGDITQKGTFEELQTSLDWLNSLPHHHKVVVAGNHDLLLDSTYKPKDDTTCEPLKWVDIIYLEDQSIGVACSNGRELTIYGSPSSIRHGNWAFQYPRTEDVWKGRVPPNTDILITHTPPMCYLDLDDFGCKYLLEELWRVRPRLHVFGHVHGGYGVEWLQFHRLQDIYERTIIGKDGLWGLLQIIYQALLTYIAPPVEARTLLVNSAIFGGLRDERRRGAVTVEI